MEKKNTLQLLSKYKGPIMGFAAWSIVMFHEWQTVFDTVPVLGPVEAALKQLGFFGVDVFFLLSGLGLTFAIQKGSIGSFYWRRIKRLLIPALVLSVLRGISDGWTRLQWLKNISGYAFHTENIYSFLWFIPAVCTLYLLFPLYYKIFERMKDKIAFTLGLLALWLILSLSGVVRYDAYGFTNRIPIFLVGVLLGWMMQNKTVCFQKSTWFCMGTLLVLGLYLAYQTSVLGVYMLVPVSNCCLPTFMLALSGSFLLAKGLDRIIGCWLGKGIARFFGFFGLFSLEFYCVQEWIGERLLPHLLGKMPNPLVNLLNLSVITLAAYLLYLVQKYVWKGLDGIIKKCRS